MAKVSVIITVYNESMYLNDCLDSLKKQTLKDFEAICVNDASTDNSLEVLKAYEKKDERIEVVDFKLNQGVSAARNEGLKLTKGGYIYFIDPDDWIDDDYLEVMYNQVLKTNSDTIVNINYIKEYDNKSAYSSFDFVKDDEQFIASDIVQRQLPPSVWIRLFKKSFIDKYNIKFPLGLLGQDVYFVSATEMNKSETFVFKGPYYHYYQRNASAMRKKERGWHYIQIFKKIFDYGVENSKELGGFKLFANESLIIDTEEKYNYIKKYFSEINSLVNRNKEIYNDFELFLFDIINKTESYQDFLNCCNPNISITYIRKRMGEK